MASSSVVPLCKQFEIVIDSDERLLAQAEADASLSNPSGDTKSELQEVAATNKIAANIALMAAHGCPPLDHPIGVGYVLDALRCFTERAGSPPHAKPPESCSQVGWKRD